MIKMMSLICPGFNLTHIYDLSGQASHWKKVYLSDRTLYVVVSNRKFTVVEQRNSRVIFYCSPNQFYDYWFDYFDLRQDYVELNADIHSHFNYFGLLSDKFFGLHVLKLEPWEAMLEVLLMRGASPIKARKLFWLLCDIAGERKENSLKCVKIKWSQVPDSEDIIKHKKELLKYDMFSSVISLAEQIDRLGEFIIDSMVFAATSEVMRFLKKLNVFTPQEARIILSWGFNRRNVIALSKTQTKLFTMKHGMTPREFMESNKEIREKCFNNRMDYFSQLIRSDYIESKLKKEKLWA